MFSRLFNRSQIVENEVQHEADFPTEAPQPVNPLDEALRNQPDREPPLVREKITGSNCYFTIEDHERGVVRVLGKYAMTLGAGPHVLIPGVHTLTRVPIHPRELNPREVRLTARDGLIWGDFRMLVHTRRPAFVATRLRMSQERAILVVMLGAQLRIVRKHSVQELLTGQNIIEIMEKGFLKYNKKLLRLTGAWIDHASVEDLRATPRVQEGFDEVQYEAQKRRARMERTKGIVEATVYQRQELGVDFEMVYAGERMESAPPGSIYLMPGTPSALADSMAGASALNRAQRQQENKEIPTTPSRKGRPYDPELDPE